MNKYVYMLIALFSFSISVNSIDNEPNYGLAIYGFITEGFNCTLDERRIYGSDILLHFGDINTISIYKTMEEREYLRIEFDTIYVPIYNQEYIDLYKNQSLTNDIFSDSVIYAIMAKEDICYLYGVYIGMTLENFIFIFGEINSGNRYYYNNKILELEWGVNFETRERGDIDIVFMTAMRHERTSGQRDKFATVRFIENKIVNITWIL